MGNRNFLHPERLIHRGGGHLAYLRDRWEYSAETCDINTIQGFGIAMQKYVESVDEYRRQFKPESADELERMTPKQLAESQAQTYIAINIEHIRVVLAAIFKQMKSPTYSVMCLDPRVQALQRYEMSLFEKELGQAVALEELTTEWIMLHAITAFETFGSRVYEVSTNLRLMLENTHLKGLSTDQLRLPHPAIYLTLPPIYDVFNNSTGIHRSEGVYVVEDDERSPRTWRLILVGKHNENSEHFDDDALYHWTVTLPDDSTVEDAIRESVDVVEEVRQGGTGEREIEVQGKSITAVTANPEGYQRQIAHFDFMKGTLVKLFRYVMNMVLYATHPDADVTFMDANLEYRRLRNRLHKLPKNKSRKKGKRKHIRKRLKELAPYQQPRIVLGRTIILDRHFKENLLSGDGPEKGKHSMRYIVSGHWHLYWTGKGRTIAKKKWVKPYFKGPEHAPLTHGKTRLK